MILVGKCIWENGVFSFWAESELKSFSLMIPPSNSGKWRLIGISDAMLGEHPMFVYHIQVACKTHGQVFGICCSRKFSTVATAWDRSSQKIIWSILINSLRAKCRNLSLWIHPWKLTCPLKRDYFNRKYIFQPLIFRGHVSFPAANT